MGGRQMSNVTIRHATIEDAPEIAKMLSHLADTLGDGDLFNSTAEIIANHGFGARPMFEVLIAQQENNAVGLALFFAHFSTTKGQAGVYVQDLWIDPAQRGSRIGQQLLSAVAHHSATSWAARYIKLAVHDDNPRAKQFYHRLGFGESMNETAMIADSDAFSALQGDV